VHSPAGETLVHAASLARVMRLLNWPAMDTGFGSEAQARAPARRAAAARAAPPPTPHLAAAPTPQPPRDRAQANSTLELIWCLETHCPFSARDFDEEATAASCKADVHNLAVSAAGFQPAPLARPEP